MAMTAETAPAPTPMPPVDQPYVGPRPFLPAEQKLFFGREHEARDLLNLVVSRRLVLFYAQSGAGKSSLVNTRLIPQLQESGFIVLPVSRVGGSAPSDMPATVNVYLFNLMQSLMQSVKPALRDPGRVYGVSLTDFLARLATDDGEHYYYDDSLQVEEEGVEPAYDYVLVVDQFEELVTTHPGRWEDRTDFFRQLDAAMNADPRLWVVLVLRADYVATFDPFAHLVADKLRARFYMERMERAAALEAIEEPARLGGRPFAEGVAAALVDNLCRVRVTGQASSEAGQYVEPVQLQVVCLQLWNSLRNRPGATITFDDLKSLTSEGDLGQFVDDALATFYEQQLAEVLAVTGHLISVREVRDWFSRVLVTADGTRNLVYQGETQTGGIPNLVVKELERHYLVRSESRGSGRWIELVHDRFIEPIQRANDRWRSQFPLIQAASDWDNRDENLYGGALLRRAEADLSQYPHDFGMLEREFVAASQMHEREQEAQRQAEETRRQRSVQRTRLLLVLATVALILMTGLAAWAVAASQRANDASVEAERQAQQAETARQEAVAASGRANAAADEANRQTQIAEYANRVVTANQLAAEARLATNRTPQRSLLLAVEAVRTAAGPQTEQSLHEALSVVGGVPLLGHTEPVRVVAASPDGRWIATGGPDGTVLVWDAQQVTAAQSLTQPVTARFALPAYQDSVDTLAFSPDGDYLATAGDSVLRLWRTDALDGPPQSEFDLQGDTLLQLAFSPDGRRLAGAGLNGLVWLWDGPVFDGSPRQLSEETPNDQLAPVCRGNWRARLQR